MKKNKKLICRKKNKKLIYKLSAIVKRLNVKKSTASVFKPANHAISNATAVVVKIINKILKYKRIKKGKKPVVPVKIQVVKKIIVIVLD